MPASPLDNASVMSAATTSIEHCWPENRKLRRMLSAAYTKELESAGFLRPRSKGRRRVLDAGCLDLESSNFDSKSGSARDIAEVVEQAELVRLCEDFRQKCAEQGPPESAALEYLSSDSESRESVACRHGVSVAQLRAAERRVTAGIAHFKRMVG